MACAGLITAAQRGDLAFVPSAAPRVLERSFGELEFTKAYAGLRELEMANPEVGVHDQRLPRELRAQRVVPRCERRRAGAVYNEVLGERSNQEENRSQPTGLTASPEAR